MAAAEGRELWLIVKLYNEIYHFLASLSAQHGQGWLGQSDLSGYYARSTN